METQTADSQSNKQTTQNSNDTEQNSVIEKSQEQTVKFEDDRSVVTEKAIVGQTSQNSHACGSEPRNHTILDFLERPEQIATITWDQEDPGTWNNPKLLASYKFPNDLFTPQKLEKIKGFLNFRAGVNFKLQINPTPFHRGRLIAIFVPYDDTRSTNSRSHFSGITGFPKTELDVGVGNIATLDIPFVSPLSHIDLSRGDGEIGTVHVYEYSALASGDLTTLDVAVWANFTNPSVQIPAPVMSTNDFRILFPVSDSVNWTDESTTTFRRVKPQWGDVIKRAATWVSGITPTLNGSLTSNISVEQSQVDNSMNVMNRYAHHHNNVNGPDTSRKLALIHQNEIMVDTSAFATSKDEGNINHIAGVNTWFKTCVWSKTDNTGSVLGAFPVRPLMCDRTCDIYVDPPSQNRLSIFPTLIAYISSLFAYWRGGFILTLKIPKTAFHLGRIRVLYYPGQIIEPDTVQMVDKSRAYSAILDLRERSTAQYRIPYMCANTWLNVWPLTSGKDNTLGTISIEVVNPLVSPDTVSSNLDIICEWSGAEDFELSQYRSVTMFPIPFEVTPEPPVNDDIRFDRIRALSLSYFTSESTGVEEDEVVSTFPVAYSGVYRQSVPTLRQRAPDIPFYYIWYEVFNNETLLFIIGEPTHPTADAEFRGFVDGLSNRLESPDINVVPGYLQFVAHIVYCAGPDPINIALDYNFNAFTTFKSVQPQIATRDTTQSKTEHQDEMSVQFIGAPDSDCTASGPENTVGEKFCNINVLLRKAQLKLQGNPFSSITTFEGQATTTSLIINPFAFQSVIEEPSEAADINTQTPFNLDLLDFISNIFRFYRGGLNVKIWSINNFGGLVTQVNYNQTVWPSYTVTKLKSGFVNNLPTGFANLFEQSAIASINSSTLGTTAVTSRGPIETYRTDLTMYHDNERTLEMTLPYYSTHPIDVIGRQFMLNNRENRLDDPNPTIAKVSVTLGSATRTVPGALITRSAAPDFRFGYLLGAPPCFIIDPYQEWNIT